MQRWRLWKKNWKGNLQKTMERERERAMEGRKREDDK